MKILKLTDPGVKRVINSHPALKGKQRIGRGFYSVVFDNEDTVLKLTADAHHYDLLQFYAEGPHFPKVIVNHGCVGEQKRGGFPLYLLEIEKLVKVPGKTDNSRLVYKMCKAASRIMAVKTPVFERHADKIQMARIVPETFYQMAEDKDLPAGIRDGLEQLGRFSLDYDGVGMDFHPINFMQRETTGELVLSDPIMNILTFNKALEAKQRGY